MEIIKEKVKKKVWFAENVKMPMEASMLCTINGDTIFLFTKNTLIRDSGALCHIMNNHTSLFDITDINKWIQGSSGNINIQQVDSNEWAHTL